MIEVGLFWSHSGSRGWDYFRAGTCSIWWALFLPSDVGGYFFVLTFSVAVHSRPPPPPRSYRVACGFCRVVVVPCTAGSSFLHQEDDKQISREGGGCAGCPERPNVPVVCV